MLIQSRNNQTVKEIRKLLTRKGRELSGCFLVTGPHLVLEALEQGAIIKTLLVVPQLMAKAPANVIDKICQLGANIRWLELTADNFTSITGRDDGSYGIGAIVRQGWVDINNCSPAKGLCCVAINSVKYPANLGTILRASDAVGGVGVILVGHSADPYDVQTIRASLGAIFSQYLCRASVAELADWKTRHNCRFIGASPAGVSDYRAVNYTSPCLLFMGNENAGLSKEQEALCDVIVRIPMVGRCDSHNLAVATSLLLYEAFYQIYGVVTDD